MQNTTSSSSLNSLLFGTFFPEKGSINIAFLLLRIYAGYSIMGAGMDKLPLPDWMVDQVVSMGFPFPVFFAWMASFSEFAFGLLLCLGLLSRLSGLLLAITMGVASFGFQKVLPLVDMHIAQLYFWIFLFYMIVGAGKISLDYLMHKRIAEGNKTFAYGGSVAALLVLLLFGFYREFSPAPIVEENEVVAIESINIPGSFNDWDPTANEMKQLSEDKYQLEIDFEQAGPIAFKFTANQNWDINLGMVDQQKKGFPLGGIADIDQGNNTKNIEAYIPAPGRYLFSLNKSTYSFTLDSVGVVVN